MTSVEKPQLAREHKSNMRPSEYRMSLTEYTTFHLGCEAHFNKATMHHLCVDIMCDCILGSWNKAREFDVRLRSCEMDPRQLLFFFFSVGT